MTEKLGSAVLVLSGDDQALLKSIGEAKVHATGLQEHFDDVAGMVKNALGVLGIGLGLKEMLDATIEAERASRLLANTVRATGMAAGFTADQLRAQAAALTEVTAYGDEAIMGVQRQLMAFRNLHGDVFREAIVITLDFAEATGRDATDAARTLGMALNDPTQGLTRLRQAGVTVTEALKGAVEQMVRQGDLAGAQRLVLDELAKSYGGTAAAARDTLGGAMTALKERFGDLFLEQAAAGKQLKEFVDLVHQSLPVVAAVFSAVFTAVRAVVEGVVEQLFYLGQGLYRLATLDLKGAIESFGQMRGVLELSRDAAAKAAAAYEQTGAEIRGIDQANRDLAASAPVAAGQVAASAAEMQAAMAASSQAAKAAQESAKAAADAVAGAVRQSSETAGLSFDELVAKAKAAADSAAAAASLAATMASQGMTANAEKWREVAASNAAAAKTYASQAVAESKRVQAENRALAASAGQALGRIAGDLLTGKLAFADFAKAVVASILQIIAQLIALKVASAFLGGFGGGFVGALAGGIGPGRAAGGPVTAGTIYPVGEQGPELFVPNVGGSIVPNHELGGGGVNVTVQTTIQGADFGDERVVGRILRGVAQAARSGVVEALDAAGALGDAAAMREGQALA